MKEIVIDPVSSGKAGKRSKGNGDTVYSINCIKARRETVCASKYREEDFSGIDESEPVKRGVGRAIRSVPSQKHKIKGRI